MDKRHAQILYGLVDQYIQTAEPVSSSIIVKKLGLSLSSASVRLVLNELDETGYIYQPHTSAGRVPTDQGYRFYLDTLNHRKLSAIQRQRMEQQYQEKVNDSQEPARITADLLSSLSNAVAICAWDKQHQVQQAGLAPLIQHLVDHDHQLATINEIAQLLQNLDALVNLLADQDESADPIVYIGEENPLIPAQYTSLIAKKFCTSTGEVVTLILTGPKRMAYQQNQAYINSLADILSN